MSKIFRDRHCKKGTVPEKNWTGGNLTFGLLQVMAVLRAACPPGEIWYGMYSAFLGGIEFQS